MTNTFNDLDELKKVLKLLKTYFNANTGAGKEETDLVKKFHKHEKTLENLWRSEEKFKSLYTSMAEGVCLHEIVYDAENNPINYKIIDVNPAYEHILNLKKEEVLDQLATEVYASEQPPFLEKYAHVVKTGKTARFDAFFAPMDKHFSISVFSPEPHRFATVFSDISTIKKDEYALKKALNCLEEEKAKSDAILAAIGDGISIQDTSYKILYQNQMHIQMMGNQLGQYCYRAYEKQDTVCDGCPVARSFIDNKIHQTERTVYLDDSPRYFEITASPLTDSKGAVIAGIEVVREVTERKVREEFIRNREATLSSILQAVPVAVGLVHDRHFSWISDKMVEMLGYEKEDLLGNSARMLYPTQKEFERVGNIKYEQLQHSSVGEVETVWLKKNGEPIDVLLRSCPMDATDFSKGVTFTALNITDKKQAAEEKISLQNQIQHVQKLESLGILAGGIAHDFNNLLMAILGNADLALAHMSPAAPGRSNLLAIEKASRRAADLCKQMLAYSGKGKFIIEPVNLNDVVNEMTHMLEVSISKTAVLKYRLANTLPAIKGDSTQIRQVLMNLIVNASEAIGDKSGIISITTGAMECDRSYLSETYLDENLPEGLYTYIEVADTGCGMEHETKNKLFDPFYTTKFTGRGLGMSAVLGIIRGHGGVIKIYSEPGEGTAIKVLLPAERDLIYRRDQKQPNKLDKTWQAEGCILLADDEETVRAVGRQMLEHFGFTVLTAEDGRQALDIFREKKDEIDCIILDLTMPHMDGEQAFREMRRINQDVKVIMSSGYNEQEVTQHFVGKGLAGFIQKPYQLSTLSEQLQKIFTRQDDSC